MLDFDAAIAEVDAEIAKAQEYLKKLKKLNRLNKQIKEQEQIRDRAGDVAVVAEVVPLRVVAEEVATVEAVVYCLPPAKEAAADEGPVEVVDGTLVADEAVVTAVDLTAMGIRELRKLGTQSGIRNAGRMKKAELLSLLAA